MLVKNDRFDQFFVKILVRVLREGWENKEIFEEMGSKEDLTKFYTEPSLVHLTPKPVWKIVIRQLMTQTMFPILNASCDITPHETIELLEASEKFLQLLGGD